jgi:hypothetical protein
MSRKLIELIIGDEYEGLPVEAISLVKHPAIEEKFVFFSKQNKHRAYSLAQVDEDKRTLIGAALIPDKEIVRFDDVTGEEYDVYFSQDTVKLASELYMKHNRTNEHTFEHQEPVEDVHVVESWIVDDPEMDKSKAYGMSMPKGTWMVRVRVDNEDMWQKVKSGEVRGFSIEGYFVDRIEKMNQQASTMTKQERTFADRLWQQAKAMMGLKKFYSEITLDTGVVLATEDDTFSAGASVVQLDEKGMPVDVKDGKYKTQNGVELEVFQNVLVEYDGQVKSIEEAEEEIEDAEKVALNETKVKFYKSYMKAKMRNKFGYFTT